MRRFIIGVIAGLLGLTAAQGAPSAHAQDTDTFHGLTPARLLDTRPGASTVDGQSQAIGRVEGSSTLALTVVGRGGVPATGVGAVALNVTVTDAQATSYLTVFPTGQPRPTTSNLNFAFTGTTANAVVVDVGADGRVSFFNGAAAFPNRPTGVHLIVDVLGWFSEGSSFNGLTPARLMDTRTGGPTIDGSFSGPGPLAANASRDVVVAGRGGVPAHAGSVALNVTVVDPTDAGYVTTWPAGQLRPTASNLNFVAGLNRPNMVIVPLGSDGSVSLYNGSNGTTNLLVDVLGWLPSGSSFTGLNPARIMDTRAGGSTVDARFAGGDLVDRGVPINLVVGGRAGIPTTAGSVLLNVTVVDPTDPGFLTAYPLGAPLPNASNLNFVAGQTVANMVVAPLGRDGQIKLFIGGAPTYEDGRYDYGAQVIVDVLGWFTGEPAVPAAPSDPLWRDTGMGAVAFGVTDDQAMTDLSGVVGAIQYSGVVHFPEPSPTGGFRDPVTNEVFPYPIWRLECGEWTCLSFGGAAQDDLEFVGWSSSDDRFLDGSGVGVGSRPAEFLTSFSSIDHAGGCVGVVVTTTSGVGGVAGTDAGVHPVLDRLFAGASGADDPDDICF